MISDPWRWWCSSIMRVPTNFDSVLFPVRLSFVGESHDPSRCQSAGMGPAYSCHNFWEVEEDYAKRS